MKLAMKLTLDGLVRGLRWKVHGLAEDAEQRYRQRSRDAASRKAEAPARTARRMREENDDRPGR